MATKRSSGILLYRDRAGTTDAELRAELLIALAVGVAMTRANGTLEKLAATPRDELLDALAPLLDALSG